MSTDEQISKFLIGVATAAHQIEGDNIHSDWWKYEHLHPHADRPSGKATNSYELYTTDRKLIQELGGNAYRFSISWARIQPTQSEFRLDEVQHYKDQIADLKQHGITPIVTLHHFVNPAWFEDLGGWTQKEAWKYFADYCRKLIKEIGQEVEWYTIVNEPNVYVGGKYLSHEMFPMKVSLLKAYRVYRNLAIAHNKVHDIIEQINPEAKISTTVQDIPFSTGKKTLLNLPLRLLCGFVNYMSTHLFIRWIRKNIDYLAINFYSYRTIKISLFSKPRFEVTPAYIGLDTDELEQDPQELELVIRKYYKKYGLPIMITENGTAAADIHRKTYLKAVQDILVKLIKDESIELIGYTYWTLVDNFEWAFGYRIKYGLYSFDPETFERTAKGSIEEFKQLVQAVTGSETPPSPSLLE